MKNNKKNIADTVEELIEPVAAELGYVIWDTEYVKEGSRYFLRISIDKDGGVDINDCEKFHRAIDPIIDEADPIEDSYVLEVSSPGMERELKYAWHYESCLGDTVDIRLYKPFKEQKEYRGKLLALNENDVAIEIDGNTENIPLEIIAKVNLYVDFTKIQSKIDLE